MHHLISLHMKKKWTVSNFSPFCFQEGWIKTLRMTVTYIYIKGNQVRERLLEDSHRAFKCEDDCSISPL